MRHRPLIHFPSQNNFDGVFEVLRDARIAARKEHICTECGRTIKKNETYEYYSALWNSHSEIYKTCRDCLSLRDTYFTKWIFGKIREEFLEMLKENTSIVTKESLKTLTDSAKQWVNQNKRGLNGSTC